LLLRQTEDDSKAQEKRERFFKRLAGASARALVLDYDGTLAPFCENLSVPSAALGELLEQIQRLANTRLVIVTGRQTQEVASSLGLAEVVIRSATRNKGDIVRAVVRESGNTVPIAYLGGAQSDEDAFAALQGYGLSALVRPQYRPTVADIWFPPAGLIAFLEDWIIACQGDR